MFAELQPRARLRLGAREDLADSRLAGDGRTYDYVSTSRAVTSIDGMTTDFYRSRTIEWR